MRTLLFKDIAILLTCCVLANVAQAQQASDLDLQALAELLNKADFIARGHPLSSRVEGQDSQAPQRYIRFAISEVLKGTESVRDIQLRQPATAEGSDSYANSDSGPDEDVILVLGAKDPADGSYSSAIGFSNGEYAIKSDEVGEYVLVNAVGVDADSVNPKDVHRRGANEPIPIDVFRRLARNQPARRAPAADPPEPRPAGPAVTISPPQLPKAQPTISSPPVSKSTGGKAWTAIGALAAIAIAFGAWIFRKVSTSRSR